MALLGQFRRDTLANWQVNNPVLADGEFALVASNASHVNKYDYWVCGDGETPFNSLVMGKLADSVGITGITQEEGDSESLAASQAFVTREIISIRDLLNEGYLLGGIAALETDPGNPSGKIFYLTSEKGTFTHFKNSDNESLNFSTYGIRILYYSPEDDWQYQDLVSIIQEEGDSESSIASQAFVSKGLTHFIDISDIDNVPGGETREEKILAIVKDNSLRYIATYQRKLVGIIEMCSDNMGHCINQILRTNYLLDENGFLDTSVHDHRLHEYVRYYNLSWNSAILPDGTSWPIGTWSKFYCPLEKLEQSVDDIEGHINNMEGQLLALLAEAKLSIRFNPSVIQKRVSSSVQITGQITNMEPSDIDHLILIDFENHVVAEADNVISVSNTLNYTINQNSVPFKLVASFSGAGMKKIENLQARNPVFCGFAINKEDLIDDTKKLSPRLSAVGNYQAINDIGNSIHYYILVPNDVTCPTHFTMGGAPYVIETSSAQFVIEGETVNYTVLMSGATYNEGAEVDIIATT